MKSNVIRIFNRHLCSEVFLRFAEECGILIKPDFSKNASFNDIEISDEDFSGVLIKSSSGDTTFAFFDVFLSDEDFNLLVLTKKDFSFVKDLEDDPYFVWVSKKQMHHIGR